ncbi:MAG TPA: hypothetical protein VG942_01915 [Hyphomonadaceae bacterium]|nr:hypothetical protein [Hyphomonadaceae bacterium]
MISEAKLSAILVAALTGVGLTVMLTNVFRDLGTALSISLPAALIMGVVMALFATDNINKGGDKPSTRKANEGK